MDCTDPAGPQANSEVVSAAPWREPARGGHPDLGMSGRPGIELLRAQIAGEEPSPPVSHLTGLRLVELGSGWVRSRLPLTGWLRRPDGRIPLGVLTIPADSAMACAIIAELPEFTGLSTAELTLRQLRPVSPGGWVNARARVVDLVPPVALAEVSLTDDDGELIAQASSLCVTFPFDATPAVPDANGAHGTDAHPDIRDGSELDPWQRPPPSASADPLALLTGLRSVATAPGTATFALPVTRWLCAPPPGRAQGGTVAMLADAAVTAAIRTGAPAGGTFVPIDLKVNYLRPLTSDGREARANARVVHSGRRIAVAGAEVVDADGTSIAVITGSAIASRASSGDE